MTDTSTNYRKYDKEHWQRVREVYGDTTKRSVVAIANEFDMPVATLRSAIKADGGWPRDLLLQKIKWMRDQLKVFGWYIDEIEDLVLKERARHQGPK